MRQLLMRHAQQLEQRTGRELDGEDTGGGQHLKDICTQAPRFRPKSSPVLCQGSWGL